MAARAWNWVGSQFIEPLGAKIPILRAQSAWLGIACTLGLAVSTSVAGNVLTDPHQHLYHLIPPLLVGLGCGFGVLLASRELLQEVRVRAEGASALRCDTLVLPVSKPFDESVSRADAGRRLEDFLAWIGGDASRGRLEAYGKKLTSWTLGDLCESSAQFSASSGSFPLSEFAWQQAWRSVACTLDDGMTRIVVLPGATDQFSEIFVKVLRHIVGARAVVEPWRDPADYTRLEQLQPVLRDLIETELKRSPRGRVRVDVTGGTRIFPIAAAFESVNSRRVVFSYVRPDTTDVVGFDVEVSRWSVK